MTERRATHLTDVDKQRLRTKLNTKRNELVAAQQASTAERRGLHERETEQGDVAEDQIEQAAALRLGQFDAALLADVDRALEKLADGTYGVSEQSGQPIPLERLDALPWARRTAAEEEHLSKRR